MDGACRAGGRRWCWARPRGGSVAADCAGGGRFPRVRPRRGPALMGLVGGWHRARGARGSESLRTRLAGGRRPRLVGTEDQEQGLRRAPRQGEGCGRVEGWRPATVRLCCLVPHGAVSRWWAAVAACGRRVSWVPCRIHAIRKQIGLAVSNRIAAAVVRLRPAGHRQPDQLGYARGRGKEPRTHTPVW